VGGEGVSCVTRLAVNPNSTLPAARFRLKWLPLRLRILLRFLLVEDLLLLLLLPVVACSSDVDVNVDADVDVDVNGVE